MCLRPSRCSRRVCAATVFRRVPLAVVSTWAVLVIVYSGDVMLTSFIEGLLFNIVHAAGGHGVPAWLLGRAGIDGFWYFFPVAFLIKTPVALHVLLLVSIAALATAGVRPRQLLRSPLRGPAAAVVVFGGFLLTAKLNIGFRHAMPVLPFVIVLAAAGLARAWHAWGMPARAAIAGLVVLQAVSVLSWYPHFIPYTSEYFPDRDRGHMLITDSSHDWGQGLTLLRRFMEEENVASVRLSYFGSAAPGAYGIRYQPLRSFFELPPAPGVDDDPRFIAISATNLVGVYIDDEHAHFRRRQPYRVLGHAIFVYERED
jgi:hypothetical protein